MRLLVSAGNKAQDIIDSKRKNIIAKIFKLMNLSLCIQKT